MVMDIAWRDALRLAVTSKEDSTGLLAAADEHIGVAFDSHDARDAWLAENGVPGGGAAVSAGADGGANSGEEEEEEEVEGGGNSATLSDQLEQEWAAQKPLHVGLALHDLTADTIRLLQSEAEHVPDLANADVDSTRDIVRQLLTVAIHCSVVGHTSPELPYELVEVLLECSPPQALEGTVMAIDSLTLSFFGDRHRKTIPKNRLAVLRSFSNAQKRLIRSIPDAARCAGRMSAVLTRLVVLSDKSTQGEYADLAVDDHAHSEFPSGSLSDFEWPRSEENKEGAAVGLNVDWQFYSTFWDLQRLLRIPVAKWASDTNGEAWSRMIRVVDLVLNAFETTTPDSSHIPVDDIAQGQSVLIMSPDLFRPQLRDVLFRSTVLSQMLIFFHALTEPTLRDTSKSSSSDRNVSSAPPLASEHIKHVHSWDKRVHALLEPISPRLLATLEFFLDTRELNWMLWKHKDGFRPFERDQPARSVQKRAGPDSTSEVSVMPVPKRLRVVGISQGERLVESAAATLSRPLERIEALRHRAGRAVPPVAEFFEQFVEDEDPENGIDREHFRRNDRVVGWRARMIAQGVLLPESQSSRISTLIKNIVGPRWNDAVRKREAIEKEESARVKAMAEAEARSREENEAAEAGEEIAGSLLS